MVEKNMSSSGLPLITIPPPTQQPSDAELLMSLIHLICLTSTLCGNISQIVLQLYTHRIQKQTWVQQFLALFFFMNAIVSLGTPWVIVETLVRHWTFGKWACRAYQGTAQIRRTLIPYAIVALYVITFQGMSINPTEKLRTRQSLTCFLFLLIFGILITFIIVPFTASAVIHSHFLSEPMDGELFSVVFETNYCVVPFSENIYTNDVAIVVEVIVPLIICVVFAIRLKLATKEALSIISVEAVNKYLFSIMVIHFGTSIWFYFPLEAQKTIFFFIPKHLTIKDIIVLLPQVATSISWIPAADFSALWSLYEIRNESPTSSRNSGRLNRSVCAPPPTNADENSFHNVDTPLIERPMHFLRP